MIIKLLNGLSANLAWFSLEIQIKNTLTPWKLIFAKTVQENSKFK